MDNRQTLLACAEDLFARRGYDAVGVQEIAETAGVTKPTLYYYFGSKKGLLDAILKERWAVLDARMADALAGTGDVACRLRQLAGACAGFFAEHRQFHLLLMSLLYSPRENEAAQTARPYLDGFYRSVVAVFENAHESLGNMRGRQEQFALTFIGVINQYLTFVLHRDIPPEQERSGLDEVVRQYLYGIFS